MKKGLLGSTALVAATALTAGMAQAAEAPTISLSGFINFQAYIIDTDATGVVTFLTTTGGIPFGSVSFDTQDRVQFGVDDAELHINIKGTADNGLEYGAKIEMEAVQTGTNNVDEARIQLSGSWGTLQLGDEDGAEDIMNYGGENVMGATGGWDGDGDDATTLASIFFPTIAGDTSDATKITYYSPRFSGIQVGVSYTPDPEQQGDQDPFDDGIYANHIGLGVNYDGTFGDVRVRASGVYSMASYEPTVLVGFGREDIAAWSVGAIVGFGPVQVGANYTDNGDSGAPSVPGFNFDDSYWNVAVGFETGPLYLSAGYFSREISAAGVTVEPASYALTADYTVAPGLTAYAEYTNYDGDLPQTEANVLILGANLSF